jgi:hypothetical protein
MLWITKEYLSVSVYKKKAVFAILDWVNGLRIPAKLILLVVLNTTAVSCFQLYEYNWIWFSIIIVEVIDINLVFVTLYKRLTRSFDNFSSYYFCNISQALLVGYFITIIDLGSPSILLIIKMSVDVFTLSYHLKEYYIV